VIASLRGRVEQVAENSVVVEVGGVGLLVAVPTPLAARLQPGQPVALFTRLIVREDALALYGFESPDQRGFFDLLLSVSGVGPKMAMSLLSHFSLETLHLAVGANQPERLAGIPGVGRKTAEKIVFHLKDKVSAVGEAGPSGWGEGDTDIIAALTALGYTVVEAQSALQSLPRDAPADLESRLRLALQYFSRR
jgi:Holliday junction DNA helicase RuvA